MSSEEAPKKVSLDEFLQDPGVDDEQAVRALRMHMSWGEWFRHDFLRYSYAIAALFIGIIVALQLGSSFNVRDAPGTAILIAILGVILAAAYLLYRRLWPEGILTGRSRRG